MKENPEIIQGLMAKRDPMADDWKAMCLLSVGRRVAAAAVVKAMAEKDQETSRRQTALAETAH